MKTVNMLLTLPTVGPNGTQGPEWASDLVNDLQIVDYHSHIQGRGKTLNNDSFQVLSNFSINNYSIKEIANLALVNLASQLTDVNLIYDFNGEFYFNDKNGNKVQLTNSGNINVGSIAGITGDYSTSDADLSYSDVSKSFIFKQTALITASTDHGPLKIYQPVLGSPYALLKQDDTQSVDLDFTWPASLPITSQVIRSTNLGVLNPNELQTSDFVDSSVINSKMASDSVDTNNFVTGSVTPSKRSSANYVISSNVSSLSFGANTNQFVSQFNITLTSIGRLVKVGLISSNQGQSAIVLGNVNLFNDYNVEIYRNGTYLVSINPKFWTINPVADLSFPPGEVSFLDNVSAGVQAYTFKFITTQNTITFKNIQSYAYEL